jgi:hypothetical protein
MCRSEQHDHEIKLLRFTNLPLALALLGAVIPLAGSTVVPAIQQGRQ